MFPHTSSARLDVSTTPRRGSFWLTAMLGLPALNIAILFAAASVSGVLVPVAVALAVVELVFLIALSPRYRIGAFGAVAAMLGNAVVTTVVPIVFFFTLLAASGCDGCLS